MSRSEECGPSFMIQGSLLLLQPESSSLDLERCLTSQLTGRSGPPGGGGEQVRTTRLDGQAGVRPPAETLDRLVTQGTVHECLPGQGGQVDRVHVPARPVDQRLAVGTHLDGGRQVRGEAAHPGRRVAAAAFRTRRTLRCPSIAAAGRLPARLRSKGPPARWASTPSIANVASEATHAGTLASRRIAGARTRHGHRPSAPLGRRSTAGVARRRREGGVTVGLIQRGPSPLLAMTRARPRPK